MRKSVLLLTTFAALASACGSVVVVPITEDVPVGVDASNPPPGVDAGLPDAPPPSVDAARPDALPPPRVDGGRVDVPVPPDARPPLGDLCSRACDRQARDCGTSSSTCVSDCNDAVASLPPQCAMLFVGLTDCVITNGFVCRGGGSSVPRACQPIATDFQNCLEMVEPPPPPPPPPPPADGGTEIYPGCTLACSQVTAACGRPMTDCEAGCSEAGFTYRATCPGVFDDYLTCLAANGFTCAEGRPQPSTACSAEMMRLSECIGTDEPPMPGTTDAGVAPPPDV